MKKITSLILAVIMSVSIVTSVGAVEYGAENANKPTKTYTQKFSDVPSSHWAFSYIGEMTERGVVAGYPNGTFCPNNDVTRAEFAKIMTAASGIQISNPTTKDFEDVATSAWYAPYIHAAYPYLSGYYVYGGNYYMPDTPALREDIAVALVKLKGYDTVGADESILSAMFTDEYSISDDARKYVAVALERGLVSGYDDDTFRGQDSISRAEATSMLWRAYQYGNDNKTFDTTTPTPKPVAQATPVPIATPTVAPTPTPVATKEPTPTPDPTPTPEPEKPYVVDTLADKVNIFNTFVHMTSDGDILYYYDNGNNAVYSLDMNSGNKEEIVDVSEIQLAQKNDKQVDKYENDSEEKVVEHYKDFEVKQLYFDETTDKLLLTGEFTAITDYYGLHDKRAKYEAILDLNNDCELCDKDEVGEPTVYNQTFKIKSGNNLYEFTRHADVNLEASQTYYDTRLIKYNFSKNSWEILRNTEMNGNYIGCKGETFYSWSTGTGKIITCELNTKLTDTGINVETNVDVLDFKTMPSYNYRDGTGKRIFITQDDKIVFYDEDNSSIRVIKER